MATAVHSEVRGRRRPDRRLAAVAAGAALIAATAVLTARLTRPADPFSGDPQLITLQGYAVSRVPLGTSQVVIGFQIADRRDQQAVITAVRIPHTPGIRDHVYAIRGLPTSQGASALRPPRGRPLVRAGQLVPVAGQRLRPPPASFSRNAGSFIPLALVMTPTRTGCYLIGNITLHYLVGSTAFSQTLPAACDRLRTTHSANCTWVGPGASSG